MWGTVISLLGVILAIGFFLYDKSEEEEQSKKSMRDRERMRRQIRDLERGHKGISQDVQKIARTTGNVAQLRRKLAQVCYSDGEKRIRMAGPCQFYVWVDHCGGLPDYTLVFEDNDSGVAIYEGWPNGGSPGVRLAGQRFQQVWRRLSREGLACCHYE